MSDIDSEDVIGCGCVCFVFLLWVAFKAVWWFVFAPMIATAWDFTPYQLFVTRLLGVIFL